MVTLYAVSSVLKFQFLHPKGERPRPAGVPEGEGPALRLPRQREDAGAVRGAQARFEQSFRIQDRLR